MKGIGISLAITSVVIAGFAQIILKKFANSEKSKKTLKRFLNFRIIIAYSIMLVATLLNVFALRYMELKLASVIDALSYIWVPLLSWLLLKEKITQNNIIGCGIIILGIIIFSI